jgi:hypothetical protein
MAQTLLEIGDFGKLGLDLLGEIMNVESLSVENGSPGG